MFECLQDASLQGIDTGNDDQPVDAVLDITEAAKLLKIHAVTMRKIAQLGVVPALKIGREWRFSRHALIEALNNTTRAAHLERHRQEILANANRAIASARSVKPKLKR